VPEPNNDTANQPQGTTDAGAAQPQSTGFENFLGDNVAEQLTADEPETSADEYGEADEAEAETEGETDQTEGEDTGTEPSMDEFLSGLTPEERARYTKRYPTAWKLANDPNQPEDVRQLLRDKINTDFEFKKLRDTREEPTLEEETEEAEQTTQQTVDPAERRKQYVAFVDDVVKNVVDPQVAADLGKEVFGAMGLDLSNPEDPEVKDYLANAPKLGMALAKGATDLLMTVFQNPNVGGPLIEAIFPGFGEMYESAVYQRAWDSVRSYKDNAKNQPYKDLPAFGTQQFREALEAAADQIPDFDTLEFKDKNGRPLPMQQQAIKKYALLAKVASGQKVNPAVVEQAVETGRKLANKTEQRRLAGRALGAGQSNRNFADKMGKGEDPVMDDLDAEISRMNSNMTPLSARK
jgi:hypothetical protein